MLNLKNYHVYRDYEVAFSSSFHNQLYLSLSATYKLRVCIISTLDNRGISWSRTTLVGLLYIWESNPLATEHVKEPYFSPMH